MKKLITLNEWVEKFSAINTIFDKVSQDLKLFTIFTSAEMFSYFVNKFGERDFYKYYDNENDGSNTNMVKQASDYIALYGKSGFPAFLWRQFWAERFLCPVFCCRHSLPIRLQDLFYWEFLREQRWWLH